MLKMYYLLLQQSGIFIATPRCRSWWHCTGRPLLHDSRAADVGVSAGLITAARAVNRSMPNHVAGVLSDLMWNAGVPTGDARVLLLGWSYKAEVGDPRETPAEPLAETLIKGSKLQLGTLTFWRISRRC